MWLWIGVGAGALFVVSAMVGLLVAAILGHFASGWAELFETEAWTTLPLGRERERAVTQESSSGVSPANTDAPTVSELPGRIDRRGLASRD